MLFGNLKICVVKIIQGGAIAAPIASQILRRSITIFRSTKTAN